MAHDLFVSVALYNPPQERQMSVRTELVKLALDIEALESVRLAKTDTFEKMKDPKFRSWSDLEALYTKVRGSAKGKSKEQMIAGLYLWLNQLKTETEVEY